MRWGFIRAFPKFALVALVLVGSTAAFWLWFKFHKAYKAQASYVAPIEDNGPKLARIETAWDHLVLVDNDLYDIDSGALIFGHWLQNGAPDTLFYDAAAKKIMARYERGFVRYSLDGKEEAKLIKPTAPAFSSDLKWAVFAKDRDLWRAEIDWAAMKFVNERRLTSIEQIGDQFAPNILMATDKTALIRNFGRLLRINLESGEVKPATISMLHVEKRRSPNGKLLLGEDHGRLFCYDLDADDAKYIALGKRAFVDYQWLDNDRCAMIDSRKAVVVYDRIRNSLDEIAWLPVPSFRIGLVSPERRFVFCIGDGGKGILVDLQKKVAVPVAGGAGVEWVNADTFAFSREVPDSNLRGTWLQTVGQSERRISLEPYLVGVKSAMVAISKTGSIIYATKYGVSCVPAEGGSSFGFRGISRPPSRITPFGLWPPS